MCLTLGTRGDAMEQRHLWTHGCDALCTCSFTKAIIQVIASYSDCGLFLKLYLVCLFSVCKDIECNRRNNNGRLKTGRVQEEEVEGQ